MELEMLHYLGYRRPKEINTAAYFLSYVDPALEWGVGEHTGNQMSLGRAGEVGKIVY